MDNDSAKVKSQILHRIEDISLIDGKLADYIAKKAKSDNNYILRKIIETLENTNHQIN